MERLDINKTQSWNKNVRYSGIRLSAGVTIPEYVVNPIKKPDNLYKMAGFEDKSSEDLESTFNAYR